MKPPRSRTEKLTVRELPDETLVYDLLRHKSHCLNRTAALVWRHCDGRTTLAELAAILHRELNLPADPHIIRLALEQLGRRHLLEEPVAPLSPQARTTRRDALKKIAVAAAALPVVMTLTARTARASASPTAAAASLPGKKCSVDADCGTSTTCLTLACLTGFCFTMKAPQGLACNGGAGTCNGFGDCVPNCLAPGTPVAPCVAGKSAQCCSGSCVTFPGSGSVCT